ncbi:hypothetical protein PPERSA_09790 [Pseudocohnilembus persalinus]|uniref:Uncharacterized protein n=1 Tax=Pseudocohnilembus persalinus TaxID=266149 RepID=A0A0V0QTR7_PSEPJ|nr:hypothetical protein PPERSA_09790 [Pseudocohnilembus persalinus]|eukprot:KRX05650.1 hypothetical protein PPERSA_09790 [Pseudocohnilembus persalinus]
MKSVLRFVLAILTCCCWWPYYNFLHGTVATCKICLEVFEGAKNVLMKVLFIIFMIFCGYWIINCILCIMGIIHVFGKPCDKFQSNGDIQKAYHDIVYEDGCSTIGSIKGALQKVF